MPPPRSGSNPARARRLEIVAPEARRDSRPTGSGVPTGLGPTRRFASHAALYNCPRTSHIPRPYVAVDIDPDFAHHTGDCLRTPSISRSNATAAQRGPGCCLRLRDDREHFRGSDYDSPHKATVYLGGIFFGITLILTILVA